jgi:hypothetical protein
MDPVHLALLKDSDISLTIARRVPVLSSNVTITKINLSPPTMANIPSDMHDYSRIMS